MAGMDRLLVIAGLILVGVGLLLIFGDKLPFRIGRLPGDIVYKGKNTTFYFPLMTSILVSVLLSLILYLIGKR